MKFLLAKKLKMGQVFGEGGEATPVTLLETKPCFVVQVKTKETKDGYNAYQIGTRPLKTNKITKSKKTKPYYFLREFRGEPGQHQLGDKIESSVFVEGEKVKVTAVSKGKGFAGVVKRWHFNERAKAHGSKDMRRPGSIGGRFPQRVIKGRKMGGRMGSETTTVKNLKIVKIDNDAGILAVKGAVPGRKGALVKVTSV